MHPVRAIIDDPARNRPLVRILHLLPSIARS
jgi:hypothetical protein